MTPQPIHTIVLYPRPHPDNIVALYLLREFGEQHFPGIRQAQIQFWPSVPPGKTADDWEREGVLMIDIGGGKFDHHQEEHTNDKETCATTLAARYLGIHEKPELKKLLEYVRRDDLEGKGIVSKDPIDRAFGLSAIIMNLNRDYPDHPEYVVDVVTRIFAAHYHEEYRRKVLVPQEWEQLNIFINFIVTPLTFLGGIFYTLDMVPKSIALITQLNPIYYLINGTRYGILGIAEGNVYIGMAIITACAFVMYWFAFFLIKKGYHLKV